MISIELFQYSYIIDFEYKKNKGLLYLRQTRQYSPYLISLDTFVLEPFPMDNKPGTRVLERTKEFIIPHKPIHTVRKSCLHYGNSLKSATNTAKIFLNHRQKVPIVIAYDHGRPLVFLPTMSANSEHNVWIALHAISNYKTTKKGWCMIYLDYNLSIEVNVSQITFDRQYTLGALLEKEYKRKYGRLNGTSWPTE